VTIQVVSSDDFNKTNKEIIAEQKKLQEETDK